MKKFMLVCCYEHDIYNPIMFDTYEEAYKAMRSDLCDMMDWKYDEVENMLESDHKGDCGFSDGNAWCEGYGNNCDWKIFELCNDNNGNWNWEEYWRV